MTSPTAAQLLSAFGYSGNKQEAIRLLSVFPDQSEIKNIKDSDSMYLIHLAASKGWTEIIELLITTYHCYPNCITRVGETSLHWSCFHNQLSTVKLLTTQYCLDPLEEAISSPLETAIYGVTPLDWSSGETKTYLQQIVGKCACLYVCIVCIIFVF